MEKPNSHTTRDELLTYEQVAAEAQMSKKWVEKQVREGHLAKVKLGSRARILRSEWERYVVAHCITRTAPDPQLPLFSTVTENVTTLRRSGGSAPDTRKFHVVDGKGA